MDGVAHGVARRWNLGEFPTKTHFFTQLPTLEDAKIVVKRFPPGKTAILLMK
jgi:hypothetical protein